MSSITGPNYSVDNQITFVIQWFRTWSEIQKDDFVEILAQKLAPGNNMNGLVNGIQKFDLDSRRVSLFSCQVKLFNEWWPTWAEAEKENLTSRLKESDPKFWAAVEEEISGTRKKLDDDFLILISNCAGNKSLPTEIASNGDAVDVVDDDDTNVIMDEDGPADEPLNGKMENGVLANGFVKEENENDMAQENENDNEASG